MTLKYSLLHRTCPKTVALSCVAVCLATVVIVGWTGLASSSEDPLEAALEYQIDAVDLDLLQAEMDSLVRQYAEVGIDLNLYQWLVSRGQIPLSPWGFIKGVVTYLFREVVQNTSLLGQLLLIAVVAAIARNLATSLDEDTVSGVVSAVLYLVILLVGLSSFRTAASIAYSSVDSMTAFVQSLTPTLFTLMVAMGGISTAAALHPIVLAAVIGFASLVGGVVVPLTLFSVVLAVVTRLSGKPSALRLSKLLRRAATAAMGLLFGVFLAIMSVRGLVGSFGDAVTMKTAKLTTSTFVPVVGTAVAEGMEVVAGASLLIKNVVGLAGVLTVAVISLYPVVKIVAIVLMYRLAASLVEPLGDTSVSDCLCDLADGLSHLAVCTAVTGIMFAVLLTVILSIGALPMMLR